ncbi:hypothetical protein [Cecembia lonarensis]|uniref:Uncharacterized protein n=1 Tax=Cecembia lonarensis (strain CCUG 58316 / KCTC 22772 / LW9) TaxID=1225176 RepID=K1L5B2_CECL9|nr:hypothetical protein [Cecembia lonarensis]EKB49971.1 hypothetical protein B879_01396 [Cecembia lonarensis LW9]
MADNTDLQNLLQKIHSGEFESMINSIQKTLELVYIPESVPTSNLCFREAKEVCDEYKAHFSSLDFAYYLVGIDFEKRVRNDFNSVIPKSTEKFWQKIRIGIKKV